MNKTVKTESKATESLVNVIKALKPREAVDRKQYPNYYKGIESLLNTVYSVYQAREKGKSTKEAESEAMTKVTAFLHTLGKANGKYISVMEKTSVNGLSSVLFDTLVYHSFKDRIYTTSEALAKMELEKAKASKAVSEAHKKLIDGKGTAKAYKEAVKALEAVVSKIGAERSKAGSENEMVCKESNGKFAKFVTSRLKAIICNRYSLSEAEAEAIRKLHNKETKAKRQAKPEAKAKAKATKPEAPKTSPEAVKKTA